MRKIESALDDVETAQKLVAPAPGDEPVSAAAPEGTNVNEGASVPSQPLRPDAGYRRSLFRR